MSSGPALESLVTKDEDPTGLLNEGWRYRDLETGTFITRDPLGFVDGPNMYAYVMANPWTKFDPQGLTGTYLPGGMASASFQHGLNASQAQLARQSDQAQGAGFVAGATMMAPGPEDAVIGGFLATKAGQALSKVGGKLVDKALSLFSKNADEATSVKKAGNADTIADGGSNPKTEAQTGNTPGQQKAETQTQPANEANSQTGQQSPPTNTEAPTNVDRPTDLPANNSELPNNQTGSYTNFHESGKTYEGKGPRSRSQASGRRVARENNDPHTATDWTPAENGREAFKQESRRLDNAGGPKSETNYNRSESPGKKYRQEDGETD